jgi:hypothetical protein
MESPFVEFLPKKQVPWFHSSRTLGVETKAALWTVKESNSYFFGEHVFLLFVDELKFKVEWYLYCRYGFRWLLIGHYCEQYVIGCECELELTGI